MALEEPDRGIERDDEARVAGEALVRARRDERAGQIAGARVDGDVDRGRGAGAVEVRPLHLDSRHVPARAGRNVEVVGGLVVVAVEVGFEVLRVRAHRPRVIELVVEHVTRRCDGRCAEGERGEGERGGGDG